MLAMGLFEEMFGWFFIGLCCFMWLMKSALSSPAGKAAGQTVAAGLFKKLLG